MRSLPVSSRGSVRQRTGPSSLTNERRSIAHARLRIYVLCRSNCRFSALILPRAPFFFASARSQFNLDSPRQMKGKKVGGGNDIINLLIALAVSIIIGRGTENVHSGTLARISALLRHLRQMRRCVRSDGEGVVLRDLGWWVECSGTGN